jgi:hypothetical protein
MTQISVTQARLAPSGASTAMNELFEGRDALLELCDVVAELIKHGRPAAFASRFCSLRLGVVSDEAPARPCGPDEAFVAEDAKPVLHRLSGDAEPRSQLLVRGQLLARLEHVISDVLADRIGDLHRRQARVIRIDSHACEPIHQLELARDAA